MSDLPERIKAWPWNNQTHAGQWHVNGYGETTEYVRADIADAAYSAGWKAAMEAAATMVTEYAAEAENDAGTGWASGSWLRSAAAALRGMEEARRG